MVETPAPSRNDDAGTVPVVAAIDFWRDDSLWQVIWPAAVALAVVVHCIFFLAASSSPAKKATQRIAMAISMPPPPPPEPPPLPPEKKPERRVESEKAPAPAAPPTPEPPAQNQPPPLSTAEPVNLGPATGQGVAIAAGTPDGQAGAPPVSGEGQPLETNRAQPGPPQAEWDRNGYKSGAFEVLNRAKRYPRKAEVLGVEGWCMVKVSLNHDGSLAARPSIVNSSGQAILDEECLAVASRVTFPPIAAHVATPYVERFRIEFKLLNR